jgi:hypothetical protein
MDVLADLIKAFNPDGAFERFRVVRTKRTAQRNEIYQDVRWFVFERDGYRCLWCGQTKDRVFLVLDHILPWSAGGTEDTRNLRTLCWDCNADRSNYQAGYVESERLGLVWECLTCQMDEWGYLVGLDVEADEEGAWSADAEDFPETESVWCIKCRSVSRGFSEDVLSAAVEAS